ncbi:uncharacterized protein LOC120625354 isoform X3 [Pararge aegeria]|uniref:uncharacterized protein LOC120625354 isoform X3 n=1 Tax=Pararge aegeria TaxID=116150 RepID=UPI0019CFA56F|nr:uncharacterized protein LOC120625354 isoform X3 [Pararge aegeria]
MYTHFTTILIGITCVACYSNYEIFKGFDRDTSDPETVDTTEVSLANENTTITETMYTVTKAATILGEKCPYDKNAYKQCVKRVSGQSEGVTKSLVNSLQMEKVDIKALTDNTICSLLEMKSDPMLLVKLLAQETAMLKFALPGFLRLLNSCSKLCLKSQVKPDSKKPLRRMTDQELVVKHFLTNKNYIELIKDSRRSV